MILKNTIRKISKSIGRYFSLLIIILIGVAFYAGIKASVPNIKTVQNDYYKETNLMDIKVISNYGLTEEDVEYLSELDGIDSVTGSYSKYVFEDDDVIEVHSINNKINTFHLIDGRMPNNNSECLADSKNYKVGEYITLTEKGNEENLNIVKFKVVGTILSPLYTANDYGTASIGNGKLKSYIFIDETAFNYDLYTELYLTIEKNEKDVSYSKSYNEKIDNVIELLEKEKVRREEKRKDELIKIGIPSENLEVKWHIQSRNEAINSYKLLENQYKEVEIIADVIPIFFILVVALMTSNTMARMISEERGEIGTFTSLGISNRKIIISYLEYVLSSTTIGVMLGYFIGTIFLPRLVYTCFPITMPNMPYIFDFTMLLLILLVAVIVMSIVTIYACQKELKEMPAYLLRPVAPKKGKSILLEKIKFIWNKLSFSWKVTFRNISRYKKRVIITLLGTAGCTFLILIGFAIKDSVNEIGSKQYNELFKYENLIVLKDEVKKDDIELKEELKDLITDELLLKQESFKVTNKEKRMLDVYLMVPEENNEYFKEYFILRNNKTFKEINLSDDGVIITPRISNLYKIEKGDYITLEDLNKNQVEVKVVDITENYVSNYVYMTEKLYKKLFNEEVTYNLIVSKNKNVDNLAESILNIEKIINISFSEDLLKQANNGINGLNEIVVLLVVISSLLAFTVLYNLTSINISERTREIATLKVLGFTDNEANKYIYIETFVTVIVGIILGMIITPPLHNYVITLLEADNMVFLREIKPNSYLYAGLLTLSFALIMQLVTYLKLKKVNMIESLKSVE